MQPANPLSLIRQLAADVSKVVMFRPVMEELRRRGLDSDDLLDIIVSDLADFNCFASKETLRYYPRTTSDYYSIWVEECGCRMFLKLLVDHATGRGPFLVITSFKKDDRHA